MDVREGTSGERCPFPCSLSSLLSLNCRARAEGLARRLQTQMRQNGGPSTVEGTLLVEANGKVRLAPCEGRTYSLDDYHLDAFHKASDLKNLRPIHVVTSEPTLHLSLPSQPIGEGSSPTDQEQEQDSDVYYDFDLVTPPEDYACSGETRMAAPEPIPEENEKPEKPESGCVTSVTSPIMFSDKYALPPSNPPSPLEDCPPEDLNSRASDVDLEAVRQLLVSSRLRSLYTVSDTERPITVVDNHFPDFVGVVKAPRDSKTPTDEESSEGTSSDEGEEETKLIYEEGTAGTSSFYLPPPSSYQIFSNQEASYESSEMPTSPKKCKTSKRRHKKRRVSSHQPQKSDSSSESSANVHGTESSSGGLPESNLSPKVKTGFSATKRDPPFKHEFCRSHSVEFWQGDKLNKLLKNSNSVEKCNYDLDTNGSKRKTSCTESKVGSVNSSSDTKSSTNYHEKLPNHSSIDSLSSPEEGKSKMIDGRLKEQFNQPNSPKEMGQKSNIQGKSDLGEGKEDLLLFDETEILEEIDAAISILKNSGNDSVGEKLAKYENSDMKTFGIPSIEKENKSEQVSASYVSSEIGAHDGCQEIVPGSQECVLCEEVPFNSSEGAFRSDISLNLSINDCDYPSFYDFNFPSREVNQSGVEDMPRSKRGRVKVKRANAEAHSPSSISAAELPEAANGDNSPFPSFLLAKKGPESVPTSNQSNVDAVNVKSCSWTSGNCTTTEEECCLRNGNQHVNNSLLSEKVNESCSLRQNNDKASSEDNFEGKCDLNSPENDSKLLHKHPLDKNINSRGEESSDYQNRNGEQPNCWSLSYQQETEGDKRNEEVFPCESVTAACCEETSNSSKETFHTEETTREDSLRGTRRKLKTRAFSVEQGPSSCLPKNVALNSIRSLSERKSSIDDAELNKTCISLLGLSYSELEGNENSHDAHTSPTLDSISGSIEVPNRSCTNLFKEKENASLEEGQLPPLSAQDSVNDDTVPMISDATSAVKNDDSTDVEECKKSPGESEMECSAKMEASSDSASSPVATDGSEKQLEKVVSSELEAGATKPEDVEHVSDEEIETLPESEVGASGDKEEEDSDEDIVISGRFKNIGRYTERVSSLSEDDGLPPPPTEVILVDYNEPLEQAPEDTDESKNIGPDLASELTRLSCDEPSVEPPSDDSQRSSEERDGEQDLQTRIKRSSSLRCGKTPPGTPGRKKIVRFADCLGLDLADIRTFLDGVPTVPPSAFCDLQVDEDNPDSTGASHQGGIPSYGSYSAAASAAAAVLQNQARRILTPMFQQPGGLPDFFNRLREQKVILENVSVGTDLSVKGVVRVVNESFQKKVFIRYTFDHWRNFHEATASYVDGSCDGFSDRFSFLLWGSFLQSNGSLVFCVKYCVNDKQYWDNNRGSNYVLQCYSAPPIPIPNAEIRPLDGRPQNNHSIEHNERHRHGQGQGQGHGHGHGQGHGGSGGSSGHYSSSFADTPLTPTDPWITRFF